MWNHGTVSSENSGVFRDMPYAYDKYEHSVLLVYAATLNIFFWKNYPQMVLFSKTWFFSYRIGCTETSLAQSFKWVRGRQKIETDWFGRGCGNGYVIKKPPDSIFGSFYTKDFLWGRLKTQYYVFVSSFALFPSTCQWQLSGTKYSSWWAFSPPQYGCFHVCRYLENFRLGGS